MTVKSLRKQLAAAIAMTLVATTALGSSTYAWFAINSKVTATGMNFTTVVKDNLFISEGSHSATKINAENTFMTTLVKTDYANVIVEPVSTKTGRDFWYSETNNVNGDGQVKNSKWVQYNSAAAATGTGAANYANLFSQNYGVAKTTNDLTNAVALGYVDYVYQLKAVAGTDTTLNLTKLDLTYADANTNAANTSFRAAVFVQEATTTTAGAVNTGSNYTIAASSGDANKVVPNTRANWIFTSSANGTSASGVNFTTKNSAATDTTNAVVVAADNVETMTYLNAADTTSDANANRATFEVTTGTHYYQVVVRVWLEGQDQNCNNTTFAKLDDGKWGLNTEWTLGGEVSNAVQFLKVTESTKADVNLASATKSTTTTTINGITYAELSVTGYWVNNAENFTYASRVYQITDGQVIEVTHLVTLPAKPAQP